MRQGLPPKNDFFQDSKLLPTLEFGGSSSQNLLLLWCVLWHKVQQKIWVASVCLHICFLAARCPNDGVYHAESSSCFQIFTAELNWTDARLQCLNRGGDLAKVRGEALRSLLAHNVTQWVFSPSRYTVFQQEGSDPESNPSLDQTQSLIQIQSWLEQGSQTKWTERPLMSTLWKRRDYETHLWRTAVWPQEESRSSLYALKLEGGLNSLLQMDFTPPHIFEDKASVSPSFERKIPFLVWFLFCYQFFLVAKKCQGRKTIKHSSRHVSNAAQSNFLLLLLKTCLVWTVGVGGRVIEVGRGIILILTLFLLWESNR